MIGIHSPTKAVAIHGGSTAIDGAWKSDINAVDRTTNGVPLIDLDMFVVASVNIGYAQSNQRSKSSSIVVN
jgi:hypothetical protein